MFVLKYWEISFFWDCDNLRTGIPDIIVRTSFSVKEYGNSLLPEL